MKLRLPCCLLLIVCCLAPIVQADAQTGPEWRGACERGERHPMRENGGCCGGESREMRRPMCENGERCGGGPRGMRHRRMRQQMHDAWERGEDEQKALRHQRAEALRRCREQSGAADQEACLRHRRLQEDLRHFYHGGRHGRTLEQSEENADALHEPPPEATEPPKP